MIDCSIFIIMECIMLFVSSSIIFMIIYYYIYIFESIIYVDDVFVVYLSGGYSLCYVSVGMSVVSSFVLDNLLFMIIIWFFVVGMMNINGIFL